MEKNVGNLKEYDTNCFAKICEVGDSLDEALEQLIIKYQRVSNLVEDLAVNGSIAFVEIKKKMSGFKTPSERISGIKSKGENASETYFDNLTSQKEEHDEDIDILLEEFNDVKADLKKLSWKGSLFCGG
ncbi:hypothetical protein NE237_023925 [Protea cynaroides]|uniref:Uncharacterized protein n=1 Tax=Protea cynaroides TaxID=273540 RepID=A0A9Q0HEX0_9MAGN|nr:hypothetical protein NE237_023925 [Protea cynaroides]